MEDNAMVCMNCGKKLKDAKSIERGFGPVCWTKTHTKAERRKKSSKEDVPVENFDIPGQMSISDFV
jgi:hypothetical protein